jgi:hypothetical protein
MNYFADCVYVTPTIIINGTSKHCPRLLNIHKTYNNRWEHSYQSRNKDPGKLSKTSPYQDNQVSTPGLIPGIKPPLLLNHQTSY